MTQGSTVTMFTKSNDTLSSNVSAKEAWGHKKRENLFNNSFVGTSTGGVSYVASKTRATNDVQGKIVNTGIVSDIAIDGAGLLVVSETTTGPAKFTRRGDFRQDELGFWKNGSDQLLKAWKVDNDGNLPRSSSLLDSLEAVNFANTKGAPVATTVISIAMNLNSDQEILRGAGVDAIVNSAGLNKDKKIDGILFPEKLGRSSLSIGDQFTFTSSDGTPKTLTFGAMVIARAASGVNTIFGATSATTKFIFPGAPIPVGSLENGHQLRITVNGKAYLFTANQAAENAANKTFNTIEGLARAINATSALKAEVDSNGRLYIAPVNPQHPVLFQNVGGNIAGTLGLTDFVPAPNTTYFNSLSSLRDAVNENQPTHSLKATIESGKLSVTSLLATATFNISATSLGVNAITSAVDNPTGDEKGRATIFISAPGHSLVEGNFVNINGMGALIPNGVYSVGAKNSNGFFVSRIADDAQFPAAAAAATTVFAPGAASWQKVAGQYFAPIGGQITASANGGGQQDITVTVGAAHGILQHDVVYVDGGTFHQGGNNITLPAGYYRVNAIGGNTITIGATASVAAGAAPGFVGDTFNLRKVGTTLAGGNALPVGATGTFNTNIFTTANGSSIVDYHIGPNSSYAVGQTIKFTGLLAPEVLNNITINNNVAYKITAINNATGVLSFESQILPGPIVVANAPGSAVYTANSLGLRVDSGSQLMSYFSIDPEKPQYVATYNAADTDRTISAGAANFSATALQSPKSLTIFDSLGSSYTLLLHFAKLDNNKWAVELTSQKDKNGVFEVTGTADGLIASGIIEFNTDGTLKSAPAGFSNIVVQHNNGSEPGNINIDWANQKSDIKTGTVSQTKAPNNVEIIQNNGQGAGTLTKLEISPEGYIIGTFSSGETRKLYKIPMAVFANVNGLIAGANGTFDISRESGELLLKEAGIGGAGRTLGGVLEASNVDTTEELLKVQELSNAIRANARVAAIDNENFKNVLSELGR